MKTNRFLPCACAGRAILLRGCGEAGESTIDRNLRAMQRRLSRRGRISSSGGSTIEWVSECKRLPLDYLGGEMSKPKNPYYAGSQDWFIWENAYDTGQANGEKRLARELRRWANTEAVFWDFVKLDTFLTARAKRGKK